MHGATTRLVYHILGVEINQYGLRLLVMRESLGCKIHPFPCTVF